MDSLNRAKRRMKLFGVWNQAVWIGKESRIGGICIGSNKCSFCSIIYNENGSTNREPITTGRSDVHFVWENTMILK